MNRSPSKPEPPKPCPICLVAMQTTKEERADCSLAHNEQMSTRTAMAGPLRAESDVLVIGSSAAGMYAAIEAERAGCQVMLVDRSLIGRGRATAMVQMTVAVALGSQAPERSGVKACRPSSKAARSRQAASSGQAVGALHLVSEAPAA